jgi:predicted Zn-dependent protease
VTVDGGQSQVIAWRYLEMHQPRRALEALAGLAGEDLDDPNVWYIRGHALLELDSFDQAAELAVAALGRFPEDVELLSILCAAEAGRDRLAEAERAVLSALELEADSAILLCQYARVLMRGGQFDKAEEVLALAERAEPDADVVLRARQLLAYIRFRTDEARELAQELLRRDAEDPQGQMMLGALDMEQVKPRQALERFGTVVRNDPADRHAVAAAQQAQLMTNPLLWPILPFERFGVGPTWVAAIAIIFGLRAAGADTAAGIATLVWIGMCVYSWIAGAVMKRKLESSSW